MSVTELAKLDMLDSIKAGAESLGENSGDSQQIFIAVRDHQYAKLWEGLAIPEMSTANQNFLKSIFDTGFTRGFYFAKLLEVYFSDQS